MISYKHILCHISKKPLTSHYFLSKT